MADIREGYLSTSACILANLSRELGRSLAWAGKARKVVDDEGANQRLARPYRQPYLHPAKA